MVWGMYWVLLSLLGVVSAQVPNVSSLVPTRGSTDGGYFVVANVMDFSGAHANASCRLDGDDGLTYGLRPMFLPLQVLNATAVRCGPMPEFPVESSVHLEVSPDNVTFSSSLRVFSFYQVLDVTVVRSLYSEVDDAGGVLAVVRPELGGSVGVSGAFAEVELRVLVGELVVASAMVAADGSTEHEISFPFSAGSGVFSVPCNVSLTVAVGEVRRTAQLERYESRMYMVGLDRRSRSLTFGPWHEVRFVSGNYIGVHGATTEYWAFGEAREFGLTGFNAIMPYEEDKESSEMYLGRLQRTLDVAQASGSGVMVCLQRMTQDLQKPELFNHSAILRQVELAVEAARDHPGLLGYYVADDTVGQAIPVVRTVYTIVRRLDPYHPAFASVSGSGNMWQYHTQHFGGVGLDVPMYELYDLDAPGYGWDTVPLTYPTRWLPGWVTTQSRGGANNRPANAALQWVVGAQFFGQGFMGWDTWSWSAHAFASLRAADLLVNRQIAELAPQILTPRADRQELRLNTFSFFPRDPQPQWVVPQDRIRPWLVEFKDAQGCFLLLASNVFRETATFEAFSPRLAALQTQSNASITLTDIWTGRPLLALPNGTIQDAIGPLSAHAYRFNCSQPGWLPADAPVGSQHDQLPTKQGVGAGQGQGEGRRRRKRMGKGSEGGGERVGNWQVGNGGFEMWFSPMVVPEWRCTSGASFNTSTTPSPATIPPPAATAGVPWWHESAPPSVSHWGGLRSSAQEWQVLNDDTDPSPSQWTTYQWRTPAVVFSDPLVKHSGVRSGRIVISGGASPSATFPIPANSYAKVALPAGSCFSVSLFVRPGIPPTNAGPDLDQFSVQISLNATTILAQGTYRIADAFQWHQLSNNNFTVPQSFAPSTGIAISVSGSGILWIDDVEVDKLC